MAKDETPIAVVKDEIAKGMRAFKAFEHGEKVLAALEGLEQNEKELTKSIEEKKKEIADLDAVLNEHKNVLKIRAIEADEILVKARNDAQQIIIDAEGEAETIRVSANKKKDEVSEALKKADDKLAEVNAEIDNKQSELTKLNDAIAAQKAALAGALGSLA